MSSPYEMFHSEQIDDKGDNFISYHNPDLDAALDQARMTVDKDARMPIWQSVHRALQQDQPYTFLTRRTGLFFIDKRVKNVKRTPAGFNFVSSWTMPIEWYVPKELQKYSSQ